MPLTPEQRDTLWEASGLPFRGHKIVSARPGTGKTTTLTEYCIDVVSDWSTRYAPWQGMAIVSYTNVAKDELEQKIRKLGKASSLLSAPHFVGTIDSFLNQYLFLPFGSKRMGYLAARPKLVGEPYNQWHASYPLRNRTPADASSAVFFDCYGFGANGEPIVTDKQPRKVSATITRRAEPPTPSNSGKIARMKEYVWTQGYALQNDANYIAYSLLASSESLTKAFIGRFPVFVIDEAQDMTEVQHALIDHLKTSGQRHIVLMGDEYQAIYEWNTARPQLFITKKTDEDWNGRTIAGTFRCSPAICTVLTNMTADSAVLSPVSTGKNKGYGEAVQVRTYDPSCDRQDIILAMDDLARALSKKAAHDGNAADIKTIAVVTRSRDDAARLQTYFAGGAARPAKPVTWNDTLTKDYLKVIYYLLKKDAYGAAGAYETLLFNTSDYDSKSAMRLALSRAWNADSPDLFGYRVALFQDLEEIATVLPAESDVNISGCAACCGVALKGLSPGRLAGIKQDCESFAVTVKEGQDRPLSSLFTAKDERAYLRHPTFDAVRLVFSTVHGVKGETYDGVIFYTKATTSNCGCIPSRRKWAEILTHDLAGCENKRIAYVALSRAAQMLCVLAPSASSEAWQALT